MVVLCFVVDISMLSCATLKAIKNCLLQFGNLCALQPSRPTGDTIPENEIGLCYTAISELSGTYEVTVLLRPNGAFDLRQFHHAVRTMPSSLSGRAKPDGFEFSKQVSSIATLLEGEGGLFSWTSQDVLKKVVMISSRFLESVTSFRQSLLEAADHFVTIEFIEIEQADRPNGKVVDFKPDQVAEPGVQGMQHEFATVVSEFENCTHHRVPFDPWSLMRLLKLWHQEIVFGRDGPVEAVLLFPVGLFTTINKLFCSFQPAVMRLVDVFKPCKICTCHGRATKSPLSAQPKSKGAQAEICGVTGQKLGAHALNDNGIEVGSGIVLSMPSFKTPVVPPMGSFGQGNPIAFDVIKCVSLDTLSEGLLFGMPYIVSPSSEVDQDVEAEEDNIQVNEQIFAALLHDLRARDCGLLCTSTRNIESGEDTAFLCFYILLPGYNGSFAAKRLAGAEEMIVPPESSTPLKDVEVSDQIRSAVFSGLSKLGTETYNPLKNLRGCHLKLTTLVKESLQPPRLEQTEKTAVRPLNPRGTQVREEDPFMPERGFDSELRSLDKPQPPPNFIISATNNPTRATPPNIHQMITPLTGKRASNRLQKSNTFHKTASWTPKGRGKPYQGLCFPPLPKQSFMNEQDPYAFSSEPSTGPNTELPLLPSKRFPNFKTARQHLLDTATNK
ncbi:unnamed protein product [Calypogeia fissa]